MTDFIDLRIGLADKGLVLNPADIGLAVGGLLFAQILIGSLARTSDGNRDVARPWIGI